MATGEQHPELSLLGLAIGTDRGFVSDLQAKSGITFPVLLIERQAAKELRARRPPVVYEVYQERITFSASGARATLDYRKWLAARASQ